MLHILHGYRQVLYLIADHIMSPEYDMVIYKSTNLVFFILLKELK
jgi:hypothetical protein